MKKYIIILLSLVTIFGCESKKVNQLIISEKRVDLIFMNLVYKKIGLSPLNLSTAKKFEVRVWAFKNDSLPLYLDRIYKNGQEMNFERYVFYDSNYTLIEDAKYYYDNQFLFSKFIKNNVKLDMKDSLTNSCNLSLFNNFDASSNRKSFENQFFAGLPGMYLFEIVNNSNEYHSAYLSDPQLVSKLDFPSYNKYDKILKLLRLIQKSMTENDKKDYDNLLNSMLNNSKQ